MMPSKLHFSPVQTFNMDTAAFTHFIPFYPAQGQLDQYQAQNIYGLTFKPEAVSNHHYESIAAFNEDDSAADMTFLNHLTSVCDGPYTPEYPAAPAISQYDWANEWVPEWLPKNTEQFHTDSYVIDPTLGCHNPGQDIPLFEYISSHERNVQSFSNEKQVQKVNGTLEVPPPTVLARSTTSSQAASTPVLSAVHSPSTVATLSPVMQDIPASPSNNTRYSPVRLFIEEDGLLIKPEKKRLFCKFCNKTFKRCQERKRHERTHTHEKPFRCTYCSKPFSRKDALTRHNKTHTNPNRRRPNRHWQQSMQL
ncbi:hypothetical protein EC973_005098 [Apophysomyces ossiformis]|uniref:C2H2-type domain-containing protein n=1 Tax=Apophysomyces ossiformis TaxID=679940 RepID=A0A8H7BE44_9FUNG|nr:hypothetical protein EC973_005098 [Apophysomyces ossiformis]